jgi:hypothetical protein
MMPHGEEFPFAPRDPARGIASLAPVLSFTLVGAHSLSVQGLLDTGAAVNVLPFSLGRQLGAVWEDNHPLIQLTGNLAACEAKGLALSAVIASFPAAKLVFAWTKADDVPLLLGQVNFFMAFDVCFFRSRAVFQIRPKESSNGSA